jgi:hypothetical protein
MRKELVIGAALLAGIAPGFVSAKTIDDGGQRAIEGLRATPVAKIETDMPDKPLGEWLEANAKGSEVQYAIESCQSSTQQTLSKDARCIRVTSLRGSVVLKFAVIAPHTSDRPGPLQCRYLIGWEGPPPGSHMARPTRALFKLNDLRTLLHWE